MSKSQVGYKQTEIGEIPEDWEMRHFGELGYLKNGVNFNRSQFGNGYKVINVTNLFSGRFTTVDQLEEIIKSAVSNPSEYFVQQGDLLFARSSIKASGTGQVAMVKENYVDTVFSGFIIRFRPHDGINTLFLNYLLRSPNYRQYFISNSSTTTITNLNQPFLSSIPIIFPPVDEQKRIADFISILDDKIELNRKMNKTLEEIGKAFFKRWFVDFEFPFDFAQGKPNLDGKPYRSSGGSMVDSEFGEIPEGWEVKDLDSISEIKNGFAFKSEDYTDEGVFLLRTRNFSQSGYVVKDEVVFLPTNFYEEYKNFQLKKFDVLLIMVGASVGNMGFVTSHVLPALQNQNMWNFRARETQNQIFIKFLVERIVKDNIGSASGSARDFFRKDFFRTIKFACPSNTVLKRFNEVVLQVFEMLDKNLKEIEDLSQARDSLLPRLMGGKLRIKV